MRFKTKSFRRFHREEDGSAAVEFSLLTPLFISLMFLVFDMGYLILKLASLDDAVSQVSRFIYTGGAQGEDVTVEQIEGFLCEQMPLITNCAANISLETRVIDNFSAAPTGGAVCKDSAAPNIAPAASFTPGGASEVMFMRVCVTTDTIFPLKALGFDLGLTETGRLQIASQTAFANEPF